jgi:hypothetical protein
LCPTTLGFLRLINVDNTWNAIIAISTCFHNVGYEFGLALGLFDVATHTTPAVVKRALVPLASHTLPWALVATQTYRQVGDVIKVGLRHQDVVEPASAILAMTFGTVLALVLEPPLEMGVLEMGIPFCRSFEVTRLATILGMLAFEAVVMWGCCEGITGLANECKLSWIPIQTHSLGNPGVGLADVFSDLTRILVNALPTMLNWTRKCLGTSGGGRGNGIISCVNSRRH